MKNEKCGIAQLCELAMIPHAVTVMVGDPGVGRTTILAAMVRCAAKSGATAIYATNDETREDAQRRFAGMSEEAAARVHVDNYPNAYNLFERALVTGADLVVLDRPSVPPHRFDDVLRVAKAPNFKAATIIAPSFTKLTFPNWVAPEHTSDVLIMLSREENVAGVVATVAKNRCGSRGQRFVFKFTQSGLAIPSIAEAT